MIALIKTGIEYGINAFGMLATLTVCILLISAVISFVSGFIEGLAENRRRAHNYEDGGTDDE